MDAADRSWQLTVTAYAAAAIEDAAVGTGADRDSYWEPDWFTGPAISLLLDLGV